MSITKDSSQCLPTVFQEIYILWDVKGILIKVFSILISLDGYI